MIILWYGYPEEHVQGWSSWLWRGLNTAEVGGSIPPSCTQTHLLHFSSFFLLSNYHSSYDIPFSGVRCQIIPLHNAILFFILCYAIQVYFIHNVILFFNWHTITTSSLLKLVLNGKYNTCRTEILKCHAEDIARHGLMQFSYTQVFIDFTNSFIFSWRFLGIFQHHIVQLS